MTGCKDGVHCHLFPVCYQSNNTYCIPRVINNVHSGLFCFIFVPTNHMNSPTWKPNHQAFIPGQDKTLQNAAKIKIVSFLPHTFFGYHHGGCPANATVSSRNHKRPSYNRHIQVLRVEVLRCCFKPFPGGTKQTHRFCSNFFPIPYREQTFTVTRSCFNNAKKEKKKITVILTKVSR